MSLPVGSHILKDPEAVARAAAERLIEACGESRSERIAICLSGGSTPKVLYGLLSGPDYATRLPWARIHWFFGDDRAVPWDDPRSNVRMVREAFGHGAPIPPTHLHFIPSDAGPDAGARAYERTLLDFYGAERLDPARTLFDLVLLGLGEDGHTASLFPGTPAADEARRLVVPVPEAGLEPFVPRISLTLPALASSRHVLFLVTGAGKRAPLARLAAGESLPAGRVTSTGAVAWLLDEAAAG
ncbi:6-phosphogluconolactonase [Methylobacterium sp.]|jgi:6-phosphogluconolactonase|uniref:6-phosphogluconolactonase n=1 Tax=Methylobacterium sp. TaxID=409 RepID=UPI000C35575B|nr:6-phosphogluconolactonase [Methylobacterium sp.]MBP33038.1 6-phosphogluconolactonase [Methylobacterium sp.]RUP11441.1 MAG: 6-phosphogluconolactonase [Methylobacterium sp.]